MSSQLSYRDVSLIELSEDCGKVPGVSVSSVSGCKLREQRKKV